jgi:hypothetical protein
MCEGSAGPLRRTDQQPLTGGSGEPEFGAGGMDKGFSPYLDFFGSFLAKQKRTERKKREET